MNQPDCTLQQIADAVDADLRLVARIHTWHVTVRPTSEHLQPAVAAQPPPAKALNVDANDRIAPLLAQAPQPRVKAFDSAGAPLDSESAASSAAGAAAIFGGTGVGLRMCCTTLR